MNVDILETDSQNSDFVNLISLLDDEVYERYGELQKQYEKYNKVAQINDVLIINLDKIPVACGAFKEKDSNSVELKRIFVINDLRGQGLGKLIVSKLEEIAKSRGYKYSVLETGIKQDEAINLYKSCGYYSIANYEPYTENINSVCMKKNL